MPPHPPQIMKTKSRLLILCASLLLLAVDAISAEPGYLFVTYRGERTSEEEQIHFALSRDGREWTALNNGAPVLVNKVGEGAARDPFLLRSGDGKKFYLLATDLAINRNRDYRRAMRAGSRSIVIWESSDLVHWSEPRLAPVAHELAGCAWSPEAIYDPEKNAYLVYWSSTLSNEGFSKQSIWATYTRDFVSFDEPFLFLERPDTLTDASVIRADGAYYRFARDTTSKTLVMERADRLSGPWSEPHGYSLPAGAGNESPMAYPLPSASDGAPSVWCMLLGNGGKGYQSFVTGNLAEGRFRPLDGFHFPFPLHQGSVLPLHNGEYERLLAAYAR